jgi:hypothetical protein
MNVGPRPDHLTTVTSEFQTSDRLRDIIERAKARSATAPPVPEAQDRAHAEATVEALLDRSQPLPDPRALSRLYKDQTLAASLPESLEAEAEALAPKPSTPGWGELPAPAPRAGVTEEPPPPPVWAEKEAQPSQPSMSPTEIRNTLQKLQSEFGGSYTVYETRPEPPEVDDTAAALQEEEDAELAELKRLAEESARTNWIFTVGSVVVVVVLAVFIYLAAAGPLKTPPVPTPTPSATAKAAHP